MSPILKKNKHMFTQISNIHMKIIYFFFTAFFLFVGCSKNEEYAEDMYLIVDHKYKETPSNIYPNRSLNVKIEGDHEDWFVLYNNDILGFEYEEGYIYKILVKKTLIKNPPQDGSIHKYELLKIIYKNKTLQNLQL